MKNALISETDDFGPMGGRFQLQTEDQHPETSGMCFYLTNITNVTDSTGPDSWLDNYLTIPFFSISILKCAAVAA